MDWDGGTLHFITRLAAGEALNPVKLLAGVLGVEATTIGRLARTMVELAADPRLEAAGKYETKLHNIYEDAVLLDADPVPGTGRRGGRRRHPAGARHAGGVRARPRHHGRVWSSHAQLAAMRIRPVPSRIRLSSLEHANARLRAETRRAVAAMEATTMPATIKGFQAKASLQAPRASANRPRVVPHVGQGWPVRRWKRQASRSAPVKWV